MSFSVSPGGKQDFKVNKVLEALQNAISDSLHTVNESHGYFSGGLMDNLAAYLSKHIDNPMQFVADSFESHVSSIREILESIINKFLISQKDSIEDCFIVQNETNVIYIALVLKEDTLFNRRPFMQFLREYEQEGLLSPKFPVIFDFVSQKVAGVLPKVKEIELHAHQPEASQA